MLRIDFSSEELNRLRVADSPDPLWETALSLHMLQHDRASLAFDPWRREVRAALARAGLTGAVRSLVRLCPHASYFPDFLTPAGTGRHDFETGLDLVLSAPRAQIARELTRLYTDTPGRLPRGARLLAEGDTEALRWLGEALRRYYAVAVRPYLAAIRAEAAADRAYRAEASLRGGPEGLLASYGDQLSWRSEGRSLLAPYPISRELRLEGRPLRLVPSLFCVRNPVAIADEALPPVMVHPLSPAPGWLADTAPPGDGTGGAGCGPGDGADVPGGLCRADLPGAAERAGREARQHSATREAGTHPMVAQLIGASRAQLLESLDRPMTTTELAAALRLAPSTASRHTSVLREAGLVASRRRGSSVVHTRTPLGEALLNGSPRATVPPVPGRV